MYILGETLLTNSHNIIAASQYANDNYWQRHNIEVLNGIAKRNQRQKKIYLNYQILDTKNAIFNLELMKRYHLAFDEICQKDVYDCADFEFNFQLAHQGLKGDYCEKMLLYHKETDYFKRFKNRAYYRGYLAKYINDQLVDLRSRRFSFWLFKSIKDILQNTKHYFKYIKGPIYKKMCTVLIMELFEHYYVAGYTNNKNTSLQKIS